MSPYGKQRRVQRSVHRTWQENLPQMQLLRPKKKSILLTPKNAVRPADAADAAKQQSSQSDQEKP